LDKELALSKGFVIGESGLTVMARSKIAQPRRKARPTRTIQQRRLYGQHMC
jgi:hypothetical protein